MATFRLYACDGTVGETLTISGEEIATCDPPELGAWVEVEVPPPFFEQPDWEVVLWGFGATITPWVIGLCIGLVIGILRKAR